MHTVSEAYLLGIREGRDLLKSWPAMNGGAQPGLVEIREIIDVLSECLRGGFPPDVAAGFRGERDFWLGQIKKREAAS